MSDITKKAILRALLEGVLTDVLPKTTGDMVYLDDTTTLAAKLSELIVTINNKATTAALEEGLAGKAASSHEHDQSDIAGLETALAGKASTTELSNAIAALRTELMGDGVDTAYDTFTELAAYIEAHEDVATALNNAIGAKADQTAVDAIKAVTDALGALANKDTVTESDLDEALLSKITNGNHTHSNLALLNTYTQTEANLKDAVAKKHSHTNATVLDGITAEKVASWDGKTRVFVATSQPADMADGDFLFQIIE